MAYIPALSGMACPMRIDLRVPFAEKDLAKSLGARWDVARRVWYLRDIEDLTPFMRWIKRPSHVKPHSGKHRERATVCRDFSLPTCDCKTPPWEECAHTVEQIEPELRERFLMLVNKGYPYSLAIDERVE
jgi:Domain of unknown function (DUF5710)